MSNPALQDVIQELKSRGLRAGEEEGARVVDASKAKGDQIVVAARAEAEQIVAHAKAEAEAMHKQLDAEMRQASAVGLEAFKQAVEKGFLVPTVNTALAGILDDKAALKEIILEAVRAFGSSGGADDVLDVILADAQKTKLDEAFVAELKARASKDVDVSFSDGFRFGFRISPEGSGYVFDFSDGGFREIFLKFLAPRFRGYFFEH